MNAPICKPMKVFLDDRGYLSEILRADDPDFQKFGQVYLSTITPGTIKAFHRHHHKTDYITCVTGQIKLVVIEAEDADASGKRRPIKVYEYHISPIAPKLVVIPPGLWHGWMCVGSNESILINVTTEPHDPNNKDEERVAAIDNPFDYVWGVKHG